MGVAGLGRVRFRRLLRTQTFFFATCARPGNFGNSPKNESTGFPASLPGACGAAQHATQHAASKLELRKARNALYSSSIGLTAIRESDDPPYKTPPKSWVETCRGRWTGVSDGFSLIAPEAHGLQRNHERQPGCATETLREPIPTLQTDLCCSVAA